MRQKRQDKKILRLVIRQVNKNIHFLLTNRSAQGRAQRTECKEQSAWRKGHKAKGTVQSKRGHIAGEHGIPYVRVNCLKVLKVFKVLRLKVTG
jgi:hypothetical protein